MWVAAVPVKVPLVKPPIVPLMDSAPQLSVADTEMVPDAPVPDSVLPLTEPAKSLIEPRTESLAVPVQVAPFGLIVNVNEPVEEAT